MVQLDEAGVSTSATIQDHGTSLGQQSHDFSHADTKMGEVERIRPIIVVCAYNEEATIAQLLDRLRGREILVINDGSTDRTEDILVARNVPHISHATRQGKSKTLSDGINYARMKGFEVLAEIGADAIPEDGALDLLFEAVAPDGIGGASALQIPVGKRNLPFYIDEIFWATLAHAKRIQQERTGSCHLGAVTWAIKIVDGMLSEEAVNDDEQIGVVLASKGLRTIFVPQAKVYFDASVSLRHILERRRRMYFGHLVQRGTTAPSMSIGVSSWALLDAFRERPMRVLFTLPAAVIELVSHTLAKHDLSDPQSMLRYRRWVTSWPKRDPRNVSTD
jgi:glycosyltransferase involved in cell wall biosynthesis